MKACSATTTTRYLDVKGAAVYLSMTDKGVYRAVEKRLIPFRRLGRKLVFDVVELDAFMHKLKGVDVAEALARRSHNGTAKDSAN